MSDKTDSGGELLVVLVVVFVLALLLSMHFQEWHSYICEGGVGRGATNCVCQDCGVKPSYRGRD